MGRAAALGLSVLLVVAGAALRLAREHRAELAASDRALERGDASDAVVHARRAAMCRSPFFSTEPAYERLESLARGAEARADYDLALFAWRAVRLASLESRDLLGAERVHRSRAEDGLRRLLSAAQRGAERPSESDPLRVREGAGAAGPAAPLAPLALRVGGGLLALCVALWMGCRARALGGLGRRETGVGFAVLAVAVGMYAFGHFVP